jgi:hypothetical protein
MVLLFVGLVCDYIDFTTHRYILTIPALICLFLVGVCLGKISNWFGQGDKL